MSQNTANNGFSEESSHIITSEPFDLKNKSQSVATVTATEDDDVSLQEQKHLAGLEESFDGADSLLSREHQYSQTKPEHREIADSAIARTVLVLIVVGAAVMVVLFMFLGFSGSGKKKVQQQVEPEVKAEEPEESDRYKAQLAVIDQKRGQQQDEATAQLEQASKKERGREEAQASPRQRSTRVDRSEPRRTRTVQRSQPEPLPRQTVNTAPSRPTQKLPPPKPLVNPQQRWSLLAAAGTQRSQIEMSEQSALDSPESKIEEPTENPQDPQDISSLQTQPTQKQTLQQTQSNTSVTTRPTNLSSGRINRVVIGGQNLPAASAESVTTNSTNEIVSKQALFQSSRSGKYQADGNTTSNAITTNTQSSDGSTSITKGAKGIISRQQVQSPSVQSATQANYVVPIGSTASAKVSVPIVWSEDGSSPTAGRFAVTLTEPLMAQNGEIALPKDTVLITEVTEITPGSHLVYQSAVAVVYRDRVGRIQQQEILPNNLIIRGERNQPLIAKSLGGSNGSAFKQDLLLGALSSLGKIGEIVNRPEEEIVREDDGFDSYRRERRASSGEADIFAAALEGFFDATADRIGKRSAQREQQQLAHKNVLVVPEGAKATVYVNAFLEVQK